MSDHLSRFRELMERVRAGSPEAVQELIDRYGALILRVIRRRLHKKLRSKFDSQDFSQDVWASFFAIPPEQFTFERPDILVRFLARMASHKVYDVLRQRLDSQKHDLRREVSMEGPAGRLVEEMPGCDPTPSQVAIAEEEWEKLMARQPSDCHRTILVLRRRGNTQEQIAAKLGLEVKMVQRVLQKLATEQLS